MKVLYITFIDFKSGNSGSMVRPQKMYEAFKACGYEIFLVSGRDVLRHDSSERRNSILKAYEWLKENRPDYCYIENSTSPIKMKENWKLIKYIHSLDIPIGYFYRDMYYKFPGLFNTLYKSKWKSNMIRMLYYRDEILIRKYVNILYVVSQECFKYFKHKDIRTLPPGVDNVIGKKRNAEDRMNRICVYVGGISGQYDLQYMMDVFKFINCQNNNEPIKLLLICREDEFELLHDTMKKEVLNCKWIELVHASGKRLIPYFEKATVGLIPLASNVYTEMAIPVKVCDYLSANLAIISTPLKALKVFFANNESCLFSNNNSVESYANAIIDYFHSDECFEKMNNDVQKTAESNNWINRVRQLEFDLLKDR